MSISGYLALLKRVARWALETEKLDDLYEDKIITLFDTGVDYISQVYGRDVDDILRYPMESPIKNPDLEDYFELIEMGEGKSDEAAKLRQKIERQSGPDYHELARADVLLDFYEEY